MFSIWGFPVQSKNLPWAMMVFHLFSGGNPFTDLIGVVIGHTYWFLKTVLPDSHGYDILKTPSLIHMLVDKLNSLGGPPQRPRMNLVNNRDGVANPGPAGNPLNRMRRD